MSDWRANRAKEFRAAAGIELARTSAAMFRLYACRASISKVAAITIPASFAIPSGGASPHRSSRRTHACPSRRVRDPRPVTSRCYASYAPGTVLISEVHPRSPKVETYTLPKERISRASARIRLMTPQQGELPARR